MKSGSRALTARAASVSARTARRSRSRPIANAGHVIMQASANPIELRFRRLALGDALAPHRDPASEFLGFPQLDTSNLPMPPPEQPAKREAQHAGRLHLPLPNGRARELDLEICDNLPHVGPQSGVRVGVKHPAVNPCGSSR